jgi:2-polyprenyl-3-methyl-5-hydroxy-6-metoxy-1,4-benzoquinol methylase
MRVLNFDPSWPTSWQLSHKYDCLEIWKEPGPDPGYAYAYAQRQSKALLAVTHATPAGGTVLDIAAAQGNFSLALAEAGFEVTWNDLREELVDYVRLKHETGVVHFAPGNAFDLTFPGLFDTVLISEIIEHVAHPDDFLRQVASLVKPNGFIVMTTPNGEYFRNRLPKFSDCADASIYETAQFQPDGDGHIFLLHEFEVLELAKSIALQVVDISFFTNPLTAGHMKLHRLLPFLPTGVVLMVERMLSDHTSGKLRRRLHTHMVTTFRSAAEE